MFVFIIIGIVLLVLGIFLFTGEVVCDSESISRSLLVKELIKLGYTSAASNELGDSYDPTGDGCIDGDDIDADFAAGVDTDSIINDWLDIYGVKPGLQNVWGAATVV